MFWLLCGVQALLGLADPTSAPLQMVRTMLFVAQCFLGAFALIGGLQMHPVASSTAHWLTRPVTPGQLFRMQTIYVYGLLFAPMMAGLAAGWLSAGFTGAQLLSGAGEWFLEVGVIATLASVVAVHSRNAAGFLSLGGSTVGGFVILAFLLNALDRNFSLFGSRLRWSTSAHDSTLLAGLVLLLAMGFFSWRLRMLTRRPALSYGIALVSVVGMMLSLFAVPFDFLRTRTAAPAGVEIEVVREVGFEPVEKTGEQLLWSHFRVTGLTSNRIAVPTRMEMGFDNGRGFRVRGNHHASEHARPGVQRIMDSPARHDLMAHLRRRYPRDTVWSGRWYWGTHDAIPVETQVKQWPKDRTGGVSGYVDADILEIERVADMPVRDGFARASKGRAFGIRVTDDEGEGTVLHLSDLGPRLAFTTDPDSARQYLGYQNSLFLLFHPDSGEVFLLEERSGRSTAPAFLNNQTAVTYQFDLPRSHLRERLTGHVADDWLDGLRLHVYQARRVGMVEKRFQENDYEFATSRVRRESDYIAAARTGVERLKSMKWPGAKDAAAARAFAGEFLANVPANSYGDQSREVGKLLTDIGPEVVPFLLREAPFPSNTASTLMRRVLPTLTQREHLPDLTEALRRDPSLAWLLRSKRWEADGVDALSSLLPGRDEVLPADALIILSTHAKPDQFADLQWHAERCQTSQDRVIRNLRELEGFPYEPTVRAAWKRARLDLVNGVQLTPFAAALGELDALHDLVRQMHGSESESRDRRAMEILADHLDATGDAAALKSWLLKNAARLRFDPSRKQYRVTAG